MIVYFVGKMFIVPFNPIDLKYVVDSAHWATPKSTLNMDVDLTLRNEKISFKK